MGDFEFMGTPILIAEDEPFIAESLSFILKREGYDVDCVSDGGQVLDKVKEMQPALLILDIMLPNSNGFEILQTITDARFDFHVSVLALTAKGQESDRKRMMELGADDFVTKPFSNQDLLERVSKLTSGQLHGQKG